MPDLQTTRDEQTMQDFEAAHALYRAGRVDEAAAILTKIDHPLANTVLQKIGRAPRERSLIPMWLLVVLFCVLVLVILAGAALGLDSEGRLRTDLSIGCERITQSSREMCDDWAAAVIAHDQNAAAACHDYQPPENIASEYTRAERTVLCANRVLQMPAH